MYVIASSPEGLEKYLASEIIDLGGFNINTYKRSVSFECDYATFYRIHFFSFMTNIKFYQANAEDMSFLESESFDIINLMLALTCGLFSLSFSISFINEW